MPLQFRIEGKIGIFAALGDVEFEEGIKVLESGLTRLRDQSIDSVLFDLRHSKESRSTAEIRGIAGVVQDHLPSGRLAVVADSDLYFGLSRMFTSQTDSDSLPSSVFRDLEEGMSWLKEAR